MSFVLVLPRTTLEEAVKIAESIRERIVQSVFCRGRGEIHSEPLNLKGLTISIGAASLTRHVDGRDADVLKTSLLHLADAAMYVAKETGRNRTAVAAEPVKRQGK